jgi:hypothetical protein
MKKQNKPKKKATMPDFVFKEFTPEEDRIYTEAVTKYREAITAGKTLKQAYESAAIADKTLEKIIQADFLKIMIAERHFSQKQPLETVAKDLSVSIDLVKDTFGRMLQEVGVSAANQFGQEFGTLNPEASKTND